jgi:D-3-phosphoglycerate dehydrogenase
VILTPHVGGSTLEAQDNIGIEVAAKLVRYSDNGSTLSAVNFPEVTLPEHAGSHRLLHIHRNVPGVLSRINEIFTTRERLQVLKDALNEIPGTLRTRVLY